MKRRCLEALTSSICQINYAAHWVDDRLCKCRYWLKIDNDYMCLTCGVKSIIKIKLKNVFEIIIINRETAEFIKTLYE